MLVSHRTSYGLGSAGSTAVAAGGQLAYPTAILIGGAAAGPVGLAVGALVALGASIAGALHIGEGCGPTCVQATNIVNQAEPTFKMNVTAYQNGQISQSQALSNFDQMWLAIQQACGGIPGVAGQNCVGDRQEGACKWRDSSGQCWNWFIGYRDPLLQPSNVPFQDTTGSVVSNVGNVVGSLFSGNAGLIAGGALVVLGLLLTGD